MSSGALPGFTASLRTMLARRWRWGVGIGAVVLSLVVLVLLVSRPVYRAEARLRLGEPPPSPGVSATGGLLSFLRTGGDPFSNDLEVLSSRSLAEDVVRRVALSVRVDAPRGWYRDSLFTSLALQDTTIKATYEATWVDGVVRVERLAPEPEDVGRFAVGEAAVFGGLRVAFAARRAGGPESVRLVTVPFGEAVRTTSGRITVERTRREANVLEIRYDHEDPGVAQAVVETAVNGFTTLRTRLFRRESDETVDSLRAVARGTADELRAAEDTLRLVQLRTGLVAPEAQGEALVERYEAVVLELAEAGAELELLDGLLARVAAAPDRVAAWATLVAHPRLLENETVGTLLQRLTLLEDERTAALALRRPESSEVRTLDLQIAQSDAALRTLVGEYRTSLAQAVGELERRLADLDRIVQALPTQALAFGRSQRDVRILSEVSVATEQRLRQEELRLALAFSNVQVVDPPALRYRPVWPRKKLGLAAGLLLAGGAGLLGMIVQERADPTVRSGARLEEELGAPVLAVLLGRSDPSERERAALAKALAGRGAVVPVGVPADAAARVADSLGGPSLVEPVGGFADAAAVAARADAAVVVVRAGHTRAVDLVRVARWLSDAGCRVGGSVVCVDSVREGRDLWG